MAALTPDNNAATPPENGAKTVAAARRVLGVALLLAIGLAGWGLWSRHQAFVALSQETEAAAIPDVAVAIAAPAPSAPEITLPGTVAAFITAPIYARTDGYVKQWFTDIGTRVKAGQSLAILDTPEVDEQLRQAKADLQTAQANDKLAQSTAKRWKSLFKHHAVSAQDLDEKLGDADAKQAATASAAANVARLTQLQGFKLLAAPFDGVVTARQTDVGALVASGTGKELFEVADTHILRIYTNVPQDDVNLVRQDGEATLSFDQYPGRRFTAKITHTADAIDPASRTLLVELQIDNQDGALLPGGYTTDPAQRPAVSRQRPRGGDAHAANRR